MPSSFEFLPETLLQDYLGLYSCCSLLLRVRRKQESADILTSLVLTRVSQIIGFIFFSFLKHNLGTNNKRLGSEKRP